MKEFINNYIIYPFFLKNNSLKTLKSVKNSCTFSTFHFMQKPVEIPSKAKCVETFGDEKGQQIHLHLIEAEFRSAASLRDQIIFLQNLEIKVTVRSIVKLLGICNDSYYKALNGTLLPSVKSTKPPPHMLLLIEEENSLIGFIREMQLQNNCMCGREIREKAAEIFKFRTQIDRIFTRDWLYDFRERHRNEIQKVYADCVDDDRAQISIDEVEQYFKSIEEMMLNPPHPFLLINMDETGFGRRADKGKRRRVYICTDVKNRPYWREKTDQYHISLVAAITAACTSLRSLCLSPRVTVDDDLNDTFFERWSDIYHTPKGYMTTSSMIYWIQNILWPYVEAVRKILNEDLECVVIADGLKSHFNDDAEEAIKQIGNTRLIPLPAHSSHLTQMLDSSCFAALKKKYSWIPNDSEIKSRLTQKLIRIKKAYESSMSSEVIRSSWEATGFKINLSSGEVSSYTFCYDFKEMLRAEALHLEPNQNQ